MDRRWAYISAEEIAALAETLKPEAYVFKLRETSPAGLMTGIDDSDFTATVTVDADPLTGALTAGAVEYTDSDGTVVPAVFANFTFHVMRLRASKNLNGAASGEPFDFTATLMTIEDADVTRETGAFEITDGGATQTVNAADYLSMYGAQNYVQSAQNKTTGGTIAGIDYQKGDILFQNIRFKKAGKYTFEIAETEKDGYFRDETKYTATVNVNDDGTGKLTPTVTYNGAATTPVFNNYSSTNMQFSASKELTNAALKSDLFSFTLTQIGGAPLGTNEAREPVMLSETVTNINDLANFAPVEVYKTGTYTFTIAENAQASGYDYSDAVYTVTAEVSVGTGGPSVSYTYAKNGTNPAEVAPTGNTARAVPFANTPLPMKLKLQKTNVGGPQTDVFTFTVNVRTYPAVDYTPFDGTYSVFTTLGNLPVLGKQGLTCTDGVIELTGGQYALLDELLTGTEYIVTETPNENYIITSTGANGTITAGDSTIGATASFTNTRPGSTPRTGDTGNLWLYVGVFVASIIVIAVVLVSEHKKKKAKKPN